MELRELRKNCGLSMAAVASRLGWDQSTVSRLETGKVNPTVEHVAAMLAIYGTTGGKRQELFDAARAVDEPGWWERNAGVTQWSAVLADYETQASELTSWGPQTVPGLLQTMEYGEAVMRPHGLDADEIALRLAVRRERQRAVTGKPYTAYLGEPSLRALVGGRRVMAAQLADLQKREDVTIRVVPTQSPEHMGLMGGFLLLRFPKAPTVCHVEMLTSGVFHDHPALTEPYEAATTQLNDVAMSAAESFHLMESIRKEMED